MLFLTGATGTVGLPLLRRLTAVEIPVRCLVRDPRRLGAERDKVQIALGDLADPFSFRNALEGVETVVHRASTTRDQPGGSIEELAGIAVWRLVRAAERGGVQRFVFFSTLEASTFSHARLMRAKAIAEKALRESAPEYTVVRRFRGTVELIWGSAAFATRDEAELLKMPLIARQGTTDAERLGVLPKPMRAVRGVG